jgi:branched-chain amino acid transport system substrate-binding protein
VALAACGSSGSSGNGGSSGGSSTGAAASGTSTGSGSGAKGASIPVTFVGDQTGVVAYVGKQILNGMKIGLKQVNGSSMLHGGSIDLTVKDTASAQANAVTQMTDAVRSNAVAIFGPALSNEALATAPIAQSGKVVDIYTEAQDAGLLTSANNYIYRVTPSQERYDPLLADHVAKLGIKSVNILYASDNPTLTQEAKDLLPKWFKQLGVKVGSVIGVPTATTDFSSIATRLESGNPGAIGEMDVGPALPDLAKALRDSGYKGQIFTDQASTAGGIAPAGKDADGIFYTVQYHPDFPYPKSKAFTKAFTKAYPGVVPTGYAATGYDAIIELATAISKSGSGTATRATILKGMQALGQTGTFQSASGPLKFVDPDSRDVAGGGAIVQWENGKEHLVLLGKPGLEQQPVKPQ